MKSYYAVVEKSPGTKDKFLLIGYHEKKKTVIQYFESIKKVDERHSDSFKLVRIHKKKLKKVEGYYDNYLVRFGPTFVPIKHYELAKECVHNDYCDMKYTEEVLQRIYRTEQLSSTDRKALEKVIILVNFIKDDIKESAINPSILKDIEQRFEEYKNDIYFENFSPYDEEIPFI